MKLSGFNPSTRKKKERERVQTTTRTVTYVGSGVAQIRNDKDVGTWIFQNGTIANIPTHIARELATDPRWRIEGPAFGKEGEEMVVAPDAVRPKLRQHKADPSLSRKVAMVKYLGEGLAQVRNDKSEVEWVFQHGTTACLPPNIAEELRHLDQWEVKTGQYAPADPPRRETPPRVTYHKGGDAASEPESENAPAYSDLPRVNYVRKHWALPETEVEGEE